MSDGKQLRTGHPLVGVRECTSCRYGDNGSNPEGCPETCLEPELRDYDPEPEHPTREELEHDNQKLREENAYLRGICDTVELRLKFALEAFRSHPFKPNRSRPAFRNAPVTKEATDDKDNTNPHQEDLSRKAKASIHHSDILIVVEKDDA